MSAAQYKSRIYIKRPKGNFYARSSGKQCTGIYIPCFCLLVHCPKPQRDRAFCSVPFKPLCVCYAHLTVCYFLKIIARHVPWILLFSLAVAHSKSYQYCASPSVNPPSPAEPVCTRHRVYFSVKRAWHIPFSVYP